MPSDILQTSFLAIVQGITEYLPISSSGHLILPRVLFGWEDPGLIFDVAVHVGSLLAVVFYFWRQIVVLAFAWFRSVGTRQQNEDSRLAWLIILATLPAGVTGFLFDDAVEQYGRSVLLIAITSVIFGALLWLADRPDKSRSGIATLTWKTALVIGVAQVFALIPGTSRSGVTMTAGLFIGLSRRAASQFSFLLAIPIIAASGLLKGVEFYQAGGTPSEWIVLLYAGLLAAVVSWLCIHYFLQLIERIGFLPFVIYRILLGGVLLTIYLVR
ncbi:MAG: undecaprenyl-diphosphate phosphatase [Pseudohongiellaceae bacterium]